MKAIGQTLQYLREAAELSGNSIAKVACISIGAYFDIERGRREASFIVIFRICRFYEISLNEFAEMIHPEELERRELSSLRSLAKRKL